MLISVVCTSASLQLVVSRQSFTRTSAVLRLVLPATSSADPADQTHTVATALAALVGRPVALFCFR